MYGCKVEHELCKGHIKRCFEQRKWNNGLWWWWKKGEKVFYSTERHVSLIHVYKDNGIKGTERYKQSV